MKNIFISKVDFAQAYFPYIKADAARQKFMRLIVDDVELLSKLTATGYNSKSHSFSPIQVELIKERLGDPWKWSKRVNCIE